MSTTAANRPTTRSATARPASTLSVAIDPVRVLRRHLTLLIVAFVAGIILGYVAYKICDRYFPRYSGRMSFIVRPPLRDAMDPVDPAGGREAQVLRLGRTEIERLLSRDVLGQALQRSRAIREQSVWGRQYLDLAGNFAYEDAIDDLLNGLRSDMIRNTNTFFLSWSSSSAADVPIVLDGIAAAFIDIRQREEAARFSQIESDWQRQAEAYANDVRRIQNDIDRFIRDHNITASDTRSSQLMVTVQDLLGRINENNSRLSMAESMREQTQAKLMGAIEPSDDDRRAAEEDPLIRSMTAKINDLRVAIGAARERFGSGHQQIIALDQRLKAAEVEREAAIRDTIRRNLDGRLKSVVLQIESLKGLSIDLEKQYVDRETQLKEFNALLLELSALERSYSRAESQQRRYEDAKLDAESLRSRLDAQRITVHIPPFTPRQRSFPQLHIFIAAGALLVTGMVVGLVFLREILNQRVRGSSDLAVVPGARVLGTIPDLADDPTRCERAEMVVRDRPQSVLAEAYRQANVPLMKSMTVGGHQTLLVIGGLPGSGGTTVATNLASSDAAGGRRVLLIDGNFRRSNLAKAVGIREDLPGLGDILAGSATADDAIQQVSDNLWAISAGTPSSRVIERLTTPALSELLADMRSRYDLVIIDAPPVLVASETMVLANRVDAVVLVIRANQEQRGLVARLINQLSEMRCDFLGIILNRPRGTAGGYLRKNYETIAGYARNS